MYEALWLSASLHTTIQSAAVAGDAAFLSNKTERHLNNYLRKEVLLSICMLVEGWARPM